MIQEKIYLGRDGLIDWLVTAGKPPYPFDLDTWGVTRVVLKLNETVSIDSNGNEAAVIWNGARLQVINPGKLLPPDLPPDIYTCVLALYTATKPDGYVWADTIQLDVRKA
ncbi:MAG: hypothetical protein KZQ99_02530 [Candidatus Thiodiazotropha sp. (ex Dulcina madagascariensis)]|nr:hypothetical protein [Candidatus Thiodiazotropha sp. (ex Dulcina madagascariensis)]